VRRVRTIARFLRYTYPALLLTPFFEEVALFVNAATPESPYWFERHLIAADRWLFGATPAALLSQAGHPVLDELMHAFYLSYYVLITAGIVLAWRGPARGGPTPARGFSRTFTGVILGFFLSFIWYPFLPARGRGSIRSSCRGCGRSGAGSSPVPSSSSSPARPCRAAAFRAPTSRAPGR
jgi:hypothetical protein